MTEVAQGVTCDPDIMGGQPCIAGQRMPTAAIRSLARAGYSVDAIQREYPSVLVFQIADALAWEMRTVKDRKDAMAYPPIERLRLGEQDRRG